MINRFKTKKDKVLTIANMISISRIFLCFPLVIFMENNDNFNTFIVILLMILTDLIDGYVARMADESTDFGKLIDPLADKICFLVVSIYLIFNYGMYMLLFFCLIMIRDMIIIIIGSYLMLNKNIALESNKSGKWFIFISSLMMISVIFGLSMYIICFFYFISVALMFISTLQYIKKYNKIFLT